MFSCYVTFGLIFDFSVSLHHCDVFICEHADTFNLIFFMCTKSFCFCFSPPLQAALLNSFPDIFDELLQMFTVQEVAEYVRGTLGSMPSTVDIGQSMDVVKLQSIARTVESRLFFFPGKSNVNL